MSVPHISTDQARPHLKFLRFLIVCVWFHLLVIVLHVFLEIKLVEIALLTVFPLTPLGIATFLVVISEKVPTTVYCPQSPPTRANTMASRVHQGRGRRW